MSLKLSRIIFCIVIGPGRMALRAKRRITNSLCEEQACDERKLSRVRESVDNFVIVRITRSRIEGSEEERYWFICTALLRVLVDH